MRTGNSQSATGLEGVILGAFCFFWTLATESLLSFVAAALRGIRLPLLTSVAGHRATGGQGPPFRGLAMVSDDTAAVLFLCGLALGWLLRTSKDWGSDL